MLEVTHAMKTEPFPPPLLFGLADLKKWIFFCLARANTRHNSAVALRKVSQPRVPLAFGHLAEKFLFSHLLNEQFKLILDGI